MSLRIVQLQNRDHRRVAVVREPNLILTTFTSVLDLVEASFEGGVTLWELLDAATSNESIGYDSVHAGDSDWKLLVPFDHPKAPSRMLVSGTGLTHLGSAKNRQSMHGKSESELTDSMRMFRLGLEGGKPGRGEIGAAPEWFYKGNGSILRTHNQSLDVPAYAEDGGEEAEIAGIYYIDANGNPHRIGMSIGNEFSDHAFEKKNYLNLAGSKLRNCSIGPELVLDPDFSSVSGQAQILRNGQAIWTKEIQTGEAQMCHSLQNIEHHHFKFEGHRQPGDLHVHFFGAHALSFGDGVRLEDGDIMHIEFSDFGRPLRNPLRVHQPNAKLVRVNRLT